MGIDYDPVDGRVYWSDIEDETIRSAKLDGSDAQLVHSISQGGSLWGLSLDSVSRLLFYADHGNKVIGMISLDTNSHQIVVDSDIDYPIDIELDKHNGVLYWSDSNKVTIERCNYDGSDRETLVSASRHLEGPNGLALDIEGSLPGGGRCSSLRTPRFLLASSGCSFLTPKIHTTCSSYPQSSHGENTS
ncbi:low-density lipoprotein receptor-related protein 5-like [Pomacea canaliculata]|uniref:low-density lipoprotein receptor-related protein 5-like n=1 Tax=Pomacea canaliculata TaxID=400727 RepID=UPI000D72FF8E|nr:low-density lipoprotein receptor-related protein 5-like [Pomacea canaliculata]